MSMRMRTTHDGAHRRPHGGGWTTISRTPRSALELELGADRAAQLIDGSERIGTAASRRRGSTARSRRPSGAARRAPADRGAVVLPGAARRGVCPCSDVASVAGARRSRRTPAARTPGGAAPPASPRASGRGRRPRRGQGGRVRVPGPRRRRAAAPPRRASRRDSVVDRPTPRTATMQAASQAVNSGTAATVGQRPAWVMSRNAGLLGVPEQVAGRRAEARDGAAAAADRALSLMARRTEGRERAGVLSVRTPTGSRP